MESFIMATSKSSFSPLNKTESKGVLPGETLVEIKETILPSCSFTRTSINIKDLETTFLPLMSFSR